MNNVDNAAAELDKLAQDEAGRKALGEVAQRLAKLLGVDLSATKAMPIKPVDAPVVEEKTEFDVRIVTIGPTKINVIKAVREITGLGLKEAKDLVEMVPKVLKEGLNKADAELIAAKLRAAGAGVELT